MSDVVLRDNRGRIRCYWHQFVGDECSTDGFAIARQLQSTNHSVAENVPVCRSHFYEMWVPKDNDDE